MTTKLNANMGFNTSKLNEKSMSVSCSDLFLTGVSNTPVSNYNNIDFNVCIDYLKIRFNGLFDIKGSDNIKWLPLLNALKVKYDEYDEVKTSCYKDSYLYDANVYIMTGGNFTKNGVGEDTTILELKGQACREFEARGGNWIELFDEIIKLNGTCKRIDLPIDDFGNHISINQLQDKIYKNLYCADWKKDPEVIHSDNGGWSMTFGKYSNKTLCIYNKVAERIDRGYAVTKNDWIRWESRFKDEAGETAFSFVYQGLVNNKLDQVVKQLLAGLIDIKKGDKPYKDMHNLSLVDSWDLWKKFVDLDNRIKIRNQYKLEATMIKKVNWISRSATKNRILMELYTQQNFDEIQGHFIYDHISKLGYADICNLNYALDVAGRNRIDLDNARRYLFDNYNKYKNLSLDSMKLLGLISDNGEILEEKK